jgi:serine/threonine-protein kinase
MANPRMTAEIGRVLGGRYRLVAPIGMGASAQVYLADDVKLRRRVALKMLHDALAGDSEFLRRFRAEARAAAALSHPNVMAVYDWGDAEVAFIVTEYLPGGSLRALLDGGNQLSPAQALGVGLEAARALDYAHRRGFVHRDIKPANLLFGEEQRLRIADFGLARALAEAAWTEPQGAVLGTARYASPEQAKGEPLSGKADVYSLALVLVEAVTGEVPFVADTTLGTLMARVDKPLVVPESLGPLRRVLERAGVADPEERIDARTLATGLLRAAKELSRPAPLPLAGALASSRDLIHDADPTIHAAVVPPSDPPAAASDLTAEDLGLDPPDWVNQARGSAAAEAGWPEPVDEWTDADGDDDESPESGPPTEAVDVVSLLDREDPDAGTAEPADHADGVAPIAVPAAGAPMVDDLDLTDAAVATPTWADAAPPQPDAPDRVVDPSAAARARALDTATGPAATIALAPPRHDDPVGDGDGDADDGARRRRWPWVVLVIALLAGGGGVAAAAMAGSGDHKAAAKPLDLPVPTLTGRSLSDARQIADASGWKVAERHIRKDGTAKGDVLASAPSPGRRLAVGKTLMLTVSDGQTIVAVPDGLVGKTTADATAALEAVGLKGTVSSTGYDEDAPKGVVTSLATGTQPKLEKGRTVGLVVSDGPRPRTVPSTLRGSTFAEAVAALDAVQLKAAKTESFSDTVPKGTVISVLPAQGASVPRGSTVTLEVSKGPHLVAVPSIKGAKTLGEAIVILKGSGLRSGNVSGKADGKPKGTRPGAGTMVPVGSSVDIVLG